VKKLIDHLFFEDGGSFMHPKESKYTATEIVADVLATPFHLLASLTKKGRPREYLPLSPPEPQTPRIVYVDRPAPAQQPEKSQADSIREENTDRETQLAACRGIADPTTRTRAEAMIEIAYRKRLARLTGGLPQDGTHAARDQDDPNATD
jgi:hypothetical protein